MLPPILLALALSSVAYWIIIPANNRRFVLLITSILLLYSLQSPLDIPGLTFIMPTALLIMTIGVGWLVQPPETPRRLSWMLILLATWGVILIAPQAQNLVGIIRNILLTGAPGQTGIILTGAVLLGVSVLVLRPLADSPRKYIVPLACLFILLIFARQTVQGRLVSFAELIATLARSIPIDGQGLFILALIALSTVPVMIPRARTLTTRKRIALIWLGLMVLLIIGFKADSLRLALATQLSGGTARVNGLDLQWIGLSYVLFRLAHVLLDMRSDSLEITYSPSDFITYVLFFPTLLAGPITRVEETVPQFASNLQTFKIEYLVTGGMRLLVGITKKFAISSLFSIIALKPAFFDGTTPPLALWIMLYAYLFVFYFDFSGYSDIAIGLGQMYGVRLPENFNRPFSQPNISLYWQSWHITLSTWFRQYWFNPVSRRLMSTPLRKRQTLIILIAQLSTMCLIAMWHQIAPNWLLWGLWQGIGLFAYKIISDRTRPWFRKQTRDPRRARLFHALNVLITFHYVMLGMVFLALPDIGQAARFFFALAGIKG